MLFLLVIYFLFLVIYALVSYAIAFHLIRYRIDGDVSQTVLIAYFAVSAVIIIGSILFIRPV